MVHDQDLVSVQEVRAKVEKAWAAWQTYKNFSQEQIDAVVEAVAARGRAHALRLAEMAVEETGYGNVEDKRAKNMLNADLLPRYIRGMKTVGVLRELPDQKITEIGVPAGVIAAICPTTNPTSTVIFKTIISLKAGNAVVHSPHPRARKCTCATAALLAEAAVEAGAPPGIIQCLDESTLEGTQALMKHPKTAIILATGGSGMVRAAYSSGKPAYGVGPGNVPILIDSSADVDDAVSKVVSGKSFDFGTVCSSEQTVVAEKALRERTLAALKSRNAYFLNEQQVAAVQKVLFSSGTTVSAQCVGQSPQKIAGMAGFSVPADVSILVAEIHGVGKEHPLSAEKLSPVLAVYFVDSFEAGMDACEAILRFGGLGHTCVIFAKDENKVRRFGMKMPAFRILVNTSAPQGSVGITTNLQPSMTLGCGAMGSNSTGDNVGPQHLINIKRIAWYVRSPEEAMPASPAETGLKTSVVSGVDKQTVVAAVERYLAERGIKVSGAAVSQAVQAALPRAAAAPAGSLRSTVENVVDRFLAGKGAPAPAASAPVCTCADKPAAAPPASKTEPPKKAEIPAPKIEIAEFVCEADVRAAIAQKRKIFIGLKTIVTPAARDLAAGDEILVMAER